VAKAAAETSAASTEILNSASSLSAPAEKLGSEMGQFLTKIRAA
jgi:hypothetical protein